MDNCFSKIYELKSIRGEKAKLSNREIELCRPDIIDIGMLSVVHEWFREILGLSDGKKETTIQRMKFIFIALFLFTPSSLAGGKMPDGMREAISRLYPSLAPCVISNNKKSSLFFFDLYRLYKSDIEKIYEGIRRRLMETEEYCIQQIQGSEPKQLSLF